MKYKISRFVPAEYDAFPPSNGFDVVAGYIKDLTDQIGDFKEEIKSLKVSCMMNDTLVRDNCYMKEGLLDMKGILKEIRQVGKINNVRRDIILIKNLDRLLSGNENKSNRQDGGNIEREVDDLIQETGVPSAPPLSQLPDSVLEVVSSPLQLPTYREVLCEEQSVCSDKLSPSKREPHNETRASDDFSCSVRTKERISRQLDNRGESEKQVNEDSFQLV